MSELSLAAAKRMFSDRGARRIYAKALAPNDNSKNQIYLGGDFEVLQVIPGGEPIPSVAGTHGEPIFKCPLALSWLDDEGRMFPAPTAQLILYPQYPEVRLSGFLRGTKWAPTDVLTVRDEGRVLLLGITATEEIIGIAAAADTPLAHEIRELRDLPTVGVLLDLGVPDGPSAANPKAELLKRLCSISEKGWIEAWRLMPDGSRAPCNGTNCVGVTLESELGILANGRAEPDFLGWEVKAVTVTNIEKPRLGAITLMTPEPTHGDYVTLGVEEFVRRYGYADKRGRQNRLNFGGIHKVGRANPTTRLTIEVSGFDSASETITRADGAVALVTSDGRVAASWDFSSLLNHWSKKHARAAYVPANAQSLEMREYRFSGSVLLAEQTGYTHLLAAICSGTVYYDPGIKLEAAGEKTKTKRRSQWRTAGRDLERLYVETRWIETGDYCAHQEKPFSDEASAGTGSDL